MFKARYSQNGLLSSLLFLVGTSLFFTTLAVVVLQLFFNGNTADMNFIKGLQFSQSVCMFILPSFLFAYFWSENSFRYLFIDKDISFKSVALIVVFMIVSIPIINLIGEINKKMILPDFFFWF